ncbi:MAG: hypothetical protein IJP48_09680 [Synergistaceae bacterium]|nr:hypothetical protein [Synergistaceae bacterium]
MNENTKPLKWHKCMIYFLLWAGAAVSLIEALVLLSGANKGLVYLMYPSMQSIDIAYSLVLIALSAYQVYTRFQLAAFKRGAPRKLLLVYLAGPAALLLYMLIISMTTDIPFYNL